MSFTTIKSFNNTHIQEVYNVRDIDGSPGSALVIEPGQNVACSMTVPWCPSQTDFPTHHIVIVPTAFNTIPTMFFLWQEGDYVRFSTDGVYHPNGQLVPGNSTVGGNRSVTITGDSLTNASLLFY